MMQPYFLPYIGYFQVIHAVDKMILYENIDYITEGWMNRNRIQIKNQQPSYINAVVSKKSSNKKISEIQLEDGKIWKKKLLNKIFLNYKGSRFFDEVFELLRINIEKQIDYLHEYNCNFITEISKYLELKTNIVCKNEGYLVMENNLNDPNLNSYDFMPELLATKPNKKTTRVIVVCKTEGAKEFINAPGGKDLYSKQEFFNYGIKLKFCQTLNTPYTQFSDAFIPSLSITDVLMHNGKEGTKKLIQDYTLI